MFVRLFNGVRRWVHGESAAEKMAQELVDCMTPSNEQLRELAKNYPPPQEWFDEADWTDTTETIDKLVEIRKSTEVRKATKPEVDDSKFMIKKPRQGMLIPDDDASSGEVRDASR